ncbi:MAG: glycine cleavage system protein H [Chloroflexi bacterium]|nr:glycine cleavage system protein H [Chloroflexota bacterium]
MTTDMLETTVDKFIFRVRVGYLYAEAGVWVAWDVAAGTARVGLTDFRQQTSGDVVFVDLPQAGAELGGGQDLVNIETIKVDLAVPAPFSGTVVAANSALADRPELINQDPYGAGWLVELRPATWPVPGLLDASAYLDVMTRQAQAEAGQ